MKKTTLSSNWTVRPARGLPPYPRNQTHGIPPIPATVPGSVHLDLHASGVIAHPFEEMHEAGLQWVDETDWTYRCEFDWDPTTAFPRRTLKFHGLDTVTKIKLNGQEIGAHDNFFVPCEIDVSKTLIKGKNELEIEFQSAVNVGDARRAAYFDKEGIDPKVHHFDERAFVRKPGYMSGWDWGPRLVSCGIWQPVELLEFAARIEAFTLHQKPVSNGTFELTAELRISGGEQPAITYNGKRLPDGETTWTVEDALWWPVGEGAQTLQTVTVTLPSGDTQTKKIGLRTIELLREKDAVGTSFEFAVNGRKIWTRGANWIPNDSFPGRITREQVSGAIDRYAALGMNMLRIWGGGLYETDDFYDACDRAGILVWQDFPYACSYYPDDQTHQEIAAAEATYQVNRLKDRTSLALWCGNNENRAMWYGKWAGAENNPSRFYGAPIYDKTLKDVVSLNDPGRAYIESSPLLVQGMPGIEHAPENSDDHYWDVWHGRGDWGFYRDSRTRFSSEFGFASSCSMAVWKDVSPRTMSHLDPTVRWHDKTNKAWETFHGMVLTHYPEPRDLEDWIYYSQLNQRDAMRFALEFYRGGDRCRGALIWQVNDCWPVQSWALEDYRRLLKPAGWEIARLYAGALICIDLADGVLKVTLANDQESAISDELIVDVIDTVSGTIFESTRFKVGVTPQSRASIANVDVSMHFANSTVVRCRLKDESAAERWVLLGEPKDTLAPLFELSANLVEGTLILQGKGVALDLVVWNEEDPAVLVEAQTGLAGFSAGSFVDPVVRFRVNGPLGTIRARSLAGLHSIRLDRELAATKSAK